jgi:hypothetical protein
MTRFIELFYTNMEKIIINDKIDALLNLCRFVRKLKVKEIHIIEYKSFTFVRDLVGFSRI